MCRKGESNLRKVVVQAKVGLYRLHTAFNNLHSELLEMDANYNSLQVIDDPLIVPVSSPKTPSLNHEIETNILQPSTSTDLMLSLNSPTPSCSTQKNTKRKTPDPGKASALFFLLLRFY